jgi:hypothetical protein
MLISLTSGVVIVELKHHPPPGAVDLSPKGADITLDQMGRCEPKCPQGDLFAGIALRGVTSLSARERNGPGRRISSVSTLRPTRLVASL